MIFMHMVLILAMLAHAIDWDFAGLDKLQGEPEVPSWYEVKPWELEVCKRWGGTQLAQSGASRPQGLYLSQFSMTFQAYRQQYPDAEDIYEIAWYFEGLTQRFTYEFNFVKPDGSTVLVDLPNTEVTSTALANYKKIASDELYHNITLIYSLPNATDQSKARITIPIIDKDTGTPVSGYGNLYCKDLQDVTLINNTKVILSRDDKLISIWRGGLYGTSEELGEARSFEVKSEAKEIVKGGHIATGTQNETKLHVQQGGPIEARRQSQTEFTIEASLDSVLMFDGLGLNIQSCESRIDTITDCWQIGKRSIEMKKGKEIVLNYASTMVLVADGDVLIQGNADVPLGIDPTTIAQGTVLDMPRGASLAIEEGEAIANRPDSDHLKLISTATTKVELTRGIVEIKSCTGQEGG